MAEDTFLSHYNDYVQAAKGTVDLLRAGVGLLPKGKNREQAEAEIERAEQALKMSEAKVAQSLGYRLCQCTWPPQIMLKTGRDTGTDKQIFKCSQCGDQVPSLRQLEQHQRVTVHNQGGPNSWMGG